MLARSLFSLGFVATVSLVATASPCDIYASGGTPCVAAHSTTRALYASYSGSLYQVYTLRAPRKVWVSSRLTWSYSRLLVVLIVPKPTLNLYLLVGLRMPLLRTVSVVGQLVSSRSSMPSPVKATISHKHLREEPQVAPRQAAMIIWPALSVRP